MPLARQRHLDAHTLRGSPAPGAAPIRGGRRVPLPLAAVHRASLRDAARGGGHAPRHPLPRATGQRTGDRPPALLRPGHSVALGHRRGDASAREHARQFRVSRAPRLHSGRSGLLGARPLSGGHPRRCAAVARQAAASGASPHAIRPAVRRGAIRQLGALLLPLVSASAQSAPRETVGSHIQGRLRRACGGGYGGVVHRRARRPGAQCTLWRWNDVDVGRSGGCDHSGGVRGAARAERAASWRSGQRQDGGVGAAVASKRVEGSAALWSSSGHGG
eukprot:ctg_698.g332